MPCQSGTQQWSAALGAGTLRPAEIGATFMLEVRTAPAGCSLQSISARSITFVRSWPSHAGRERQRWGWSNRVVTMAELGNGCLRDGGGGLN
jgi:hypothetical protein